MWVEFNSIVSSEWSQAHGFFYSRYVCCSIYAVWAHRCYSSILPAKYRCATGYTTAEPH